MLLYISKTSMFWHRMITNSLSIQGNGALGITENSYIGAHWNFNGYDADDVSDSNADVSDLYYRYDFFTSLLCAGGSHGQPHTI